MRYVLASFAVLLGLVAVARAADEPIDPALAAKVQTLLTKMDDDDWRVREEAATDLATLPADILPLIEMALRDRKLSSEVQHRLSLMIEDLRRNGAISVKTKERQAEFAKYRDFVLKQYADNGTHDPKWDAAVREALVKHLAVAQYHGIGKATLERTITAQKNAMDLGCDDPLLKLGLLLDIARQKGPKFDQYDRVSAMTDAMLASKYCTSFKVMAINARCHAARTRWSVTENGVQKDKYLADLDKSVSLLPATKGDLFPNIDGVNILAIDLFQMYVDTYQQDLHDKRRDLIAAKVEEASDKTAALVFTAKADLIARMNVGYSMPRGKAYLEHARQSAGEALKLSPQFSRAASLKLSATNPKEDPAAFLQAYKDAIAIDPDEQANYDLMMAYVVTRNNPEAVLKYGDACIATQAWLTDVPLVAVNGISDLYNKIGQDEFLTAPETWQRIHDAYEGCLRVRPTDNSLRSYYAFWAFTTQHWAIADEQFTLLGEDLNPGPFGSDADAGYARRKAKRMATEAK